MLESDHISLLRIFQISTAPAKQSLRYTLIYVTMNFTAVEQNIHFTQVEAMKYGLR
jgi:hypothetical protein